MSTILKDRISGIKPGICIHWHRESRCVSFSMNRNYDSDRPLLVDGHRLYRGTGNDDKVYFPLLQSQKDFGALAFLLGETCGLNAVSIDGLAWPTYQFMETEKIK